MRFANVRGRASLVIDSDADGGVAVDLERASAGEFPSDPMANFALWDKLRKHAASIAGGEPQPFTMHDLRAPSPRPAQVFGIGLNFRQHAVETGAEIPDSPLTFTKFASSVNAPFGEIPIGVPTADWEVELVTVVAAGGRNIPESKAWDALAGVCVGQDISDRLLQRATTPPQFSLGKSRRGYAPFGPWLVDVAQLGDRDNLMMHCSVNDEEMQRSSTSDMIFSVSQLVAYLSTIVELLPGDVIYTGTPSGVGGARKPPRFLAAGDVITSTIEGVGSITNRCVSA